LFSEYLPDIAYDCLSHHLPKSEINYFDILSYIALNDDLDILQSNSTFSDTQVVLYKGSKFFIEALFWMNGTTSIHQHGFCGAFSLLNGRSINVEYQFTKKLRINSHCYLGDLHLKENLILTPGMVRKILPGSGLIHSVFHLDTPSITIVIRNNSCDDHQPQLDYFSPHLAVNGWYKDKALEKRVQCIDLMLQNNKTQAYPILETFIGQANLHQIFIFFEKIKLFQLDKEYIEKISMLITEKHGGHLFLKSLSDMNKDQRLAKLRFFIKDAGQRIILAILRSTPGKKNIINNFNKIFISPTTKN